MAGQGGGDEDFPRTAPACDRSTICDDQEHHDSIYNGILISLGEAYGIRSPNDLEDFLQDPQSRDIRHKGYPFPNDQMIRH